jgi:hypothetical protein
MGDAAADRAAVADRAIGNARSHLAQHFAAGEPPAHVLDAGMGDAGADAEGGTDVVHARQRFQARHIDEERGTRQPQVQHRTERLPAGQKLAAAFGLGQRRERLSHVGRPQIVEARGLHATPDETGADGPARSSAASRRRGVSGVSLSSTPNGRSASLTALKITAGGAIAPPSPMPLMPNSV